MIWSFLVSAFAMIFSIRSTTVVEMEAFSYLFISLRSSETASARVSVPSSSFYWNSRIGCRDFSRSDFCWASLASALEGGSTLLEEFDLTGSPLS